MSKKPRPNYVIPFPDFWDENITTFTESGIIFTSDVTKTPVSYESDGTAHGNQEVVHSHKIGQDSDEETG